jgi:hypothetical protein
LAGGGKKLSRGRAKRGILTISPSAPSTSHISREIVLRSVDHGKSQTERKPDFGHDRHFQMKARSGGREVVKEVEENVTRTQEQKVDAPNPNQLGGDPSPKITKIDEHPQE